MSVSTNGTTENGDGSLTGVFCMTRDSSIGIFAGISISTYRCQGAATIDIMENITAIDCNIGITCDNTNPDVITATETTAIDVAISSSTLTFSSYSITVDDNICTARNTS